MYFMNSRGEKFFSGLSGTYRVNFDDNPENYIQFDDEDDENTFYNNDKWSDKCQF